MRKLEKMEIFVVMPNVNPHGGYIHTGENIILCEDQDIEYENVDDENGNKKEVEVENTIVKQMIVDNKLITNLKSKYMMRNGKWVEEETHQEIELTKGQLLIYVKGKGFVIPEYKMLKVDEAIKCFDIYKEDNK